MQARDRLLFLFGEKKRGEMCIMYIVKEARLRLSVWVGGGI